MQSVTLMVFPFLCEACSKAVFERRFQRLFLIRHFVSGASFCSSRSCVRWCSWTPETKHLRGERDRDRAMVSVGNGSKSGNPGDQTPQKEHVFWHHDKMINMIKDRLRVFSYILVRGPAKHVLRTSTQLRKYAAKLLNKCFTRFRASGIDETSSFEDPDHRSCGPL